MAITVADLVFNLQTTGNAQRDLQLLQRRAQQAENDARQLNTRLQQINGPQRATRELTLTQHELTRTQEGARRTGEALNRMGDRMNSMGSASGGGAGQGFMDSFGSRVSSLGSKAGPIGMALVGVVALGVGAGALLMKAITDGMDKEQQRDKIQAQMGVDDATMQKIGTASAKAYTNAFGESVNDNMSAAKDAIQSGLIDPKATANDMQPIIEKLNLIKDLTGEEIPKVSRAAAQLIKTGMAKDAAGAFDILTKATQNGLNVSEDLLDTVDEYSTQFRKLGLEGPEAMGLMQQAVKAGARDTDTAADALKEFAIRAVDGSDTTVDGFTKIGLSADDMASKMSKGGQEAHDALGLTLDKLREIKDPTERARLAVELFGTKAEDLGDALYAMNLGKASADFGQVAGAANAAATTMGDNAATKMESARRSIEVSMDGVKTSMANAFGPTLGKIADWISTHKPEIIGFFVAMTDAALATAQGIASFVSGTLRTLSFFAEASGKFFGGFLNSLGQVSSGLGGIIKHIPGMEDTGKAMESVGNGMKQYDDKMSDLSGTLSGFADKVDKGNDALGNIRDTIHQSGIDAENSEKIFRALGDGVEAVPGSKDITVKTNSPEIIQKLEDLGLKVTHLPDGTIKVSADTDKGQEIIDGFIRQNNGKTINLEAEVALSARVKNGDLVVSPGSAWASRQADGGIAGPVVQGDQAKIAHTAINQWAEAGPEAWIPMAPGKRGRSTAILAQVAQTFGLALIKRANGGIADPSQLADDSRGIEGAPYTWGGWGQGWDTDCSGAQARIANMIAYGDPDQGGRFATGNEADALAARGAKPGRAPDGVAAYEWGWMNGGPGGGHTAGTLFDGKGGSLNIEMGGNRGNGQFGGQAAGSRDPYFTDSAWIALTTGTGTPGSSRGLNGSDGASLGGGSGGSPSVSVNMPDTMNVNVLNWPPALADPNGGGAKARFGVALYGKGGTVPGAGTGDTEPALLTPGEEVIPVGPAARFRGVLKAITAGRYAAGGTVGKGGVAGGSGFGGGYDPNPDPAHKLSLMDLAGLAAGLGLTAASAFDSSGKFQGFNTGNTSVPGLEEALNALAQKIQPVPAVVVEHAEVKANDPQGLLNGLLNTNPAQIQITQKGLF